MKCIAYLICLISIICLMQCNRPEKEPFKPKPVKKPFDSDQVEAIAIYKGAKRWGADILEPLEREKLIQLEDKDIEFDITDTPIITQLVNGIKFEYPIYGIPQMIPHAFIVFKLKDGSIKKGFFIDKYQFFFFVDETPSDTHLLRFMYKVDPTAGYEKFAKEVKK